MGLWIWESRRIRRSMRAVVKEVKAVVRTVTKSKCAPVWLNSPRRMKSEVRFQFSIPSNKSDTANGEIDEDYTYITYQNLLKPPKF